MQTETRAICVRRTPFVPYDEKSRAADSVKVFLDSIEEMGLNTVWLWAPFYDSIPELVEEQFDKGYAHDANTFHSNVIEPLFVEGRKRGIDVIPWVFTANYSVTDGDENLLQRTKKGEAVGLACFANPAAREKMVEKVVRLVRDMEIPYFVHEDCLQYFHDVACYCDYCKQHAPIGTDQWIPWKGQQITTMLRELRKELDVCCPDLKSAQSNDSVLGHWIPDEQWSEEGLIDIIVPMTYVTTCVASEKHYDYKRGTTRDEAINKMSHVAGMPFNEAFLKWFEEKVSQVVKTHPKSIVLPGIEITGWSDFAEWRTPRDLYDQTVDKCRQMGVPGFYLFMYVKEDCRDFRVKSL